MNIGLGRGTAQKRVTGGRWRRIVLGELLAERLVELWGSPRLWPYMTDQWVCDCMVIFVGECPAHAAPCVQYSLHSTFVLLRCHGDAVTRRVGARSVAAFARSQ